MEREPTIILEPRPESPCPPLAHSPLQTQPPRSEVTIETTLSGRAKDYSFVTDGERGDEGAHTLTKKRHTHTQTHLLTLPRGDCEPSDSYIVVAVRVIQS